MAKHIRSKPYLFSKTDFVRGMQCKKRIYLDKFCSEFRTPPDAATRNRFRKGYAFELAFKQQFPQAINMKEIHPHISESYIYQTEAILAQPEERVVFEAGILYTDVLVLTDVLRKNPDGSFDIYEVKHSEQLNDAIRWDVSIQYYACKSKLHTIGSFNLVTRKNESDFVITDMTDFVERQQPVVVSKLEEFREIIQGFEPDIPMGEQCDSPYTCDFKHYCSLKAI